MEREQATCTECGIQSLDCMVYAYCPECEAQHRRDLVPGFAVKQLVEAAEELLKESEYFTRKRCSGHGEPYGKGTDGERLTREALAAVREEMGKPDYPPRGRPTPTYEP